MTKQQIFQAYKDYIMPTYTKMPYIFVKAKGMKLFDIDGHEYLDFFPGWGVGNVGHCNSHVLAAVRDQMGKMIHLPNNFYHPAQARLASELVRASFPGKVFFANSGAEANEAAIKLARAVGSAGLGVPRYEIITFANAFHGRTLATITATGQKKYQKGFDPLVEGFVTNVPLNDKAAVEKATGERAIAVMLEVVQGEGGLNVVSLDFMTWLRKFTEERKMLLIIDEVQTGIGRTGKMFGYQNYAVTPDIITLAKSLGGGLPIGCMIAASAIADTLGPGMHASTFGGNPVVCKAALGVLKAVQKEKLLSNTMKMSALLFEKLEALKKKHAVVKEVRGLGLMVGVELTVPGKPVVEACLKRRVLINCTHDTVLRLMPALNVTRAQIDRALAALDAALTEVVHGS